MTIEKSRFNSEAAPQSNACQKDILAVTESDISVIRFEGKKVRIVNCDGKPTATPLPSSRHYLEGNSLQLIIIIFSGPFRRSALLRGGVRADSRYI